MNPTREQMRDWAKSAGIIPQIISDARIEDFAALAYAAGKDAGLERAAEVCEQKRDKALAAQTNDPHDQSNIMLRQVAYLGAEDCAAAIRALKGEKE